MAPSTQNKSTRLPIARVQLTLGVKLLRVVWLTVYYLAYRFSPVPLHAWRCFLLRCFGAKVGAGAHPYPSAKIWAPWNLEMGPGSCLSREVDCYSVGKVVLGEGSTVSQYSYLCSASHDYQDREFPLTAGAIVIGRKAWVAADAFVGPGVRIGEGAVVGARAVVTRDVDPWNVVAGNPAKYVKMRDREKAI